MLRDLFRKPKYVTLTSKSEAKISADKTIHDSVTARKELPDGLWSKCPGCGELLFNKDLENNAKVCLACGYHFRLSAKERLALTVDPESFEE